ncbi:MAG TPA: thiamine pyrophosphate-dependent enzyme [Micropepsaceae bacterium]|nr:thiamine pyrophosphate-dependent enzyme [Micropepsaceae bacterium]
MSKTPNMKRRQFLAGAVAAGPVIGLASATRAVGAETAPAKSAVPAKPQTAGDTQPPKEVQKLVTGGKVGGDFMVDCMRALNIDYVTSCPGSTFRGLQESIVNYGMNSKPEFITCIHEEASVAMAHGYAKIAGKPLASMVHGVVGLQHSSMAIYNAFCDQVPAIVLAGNVGQGTARRPGVEWAHSAHDQAIMVRDYTKWDDQANNLQDFAEGLVRAYDLATTAPMGPVLCVIDADQQEEEIEPGRKLFIPKLRQRSHPTGDPNALAEAAKLLAAAENPVIVTGRYTRSEAGPKRLVQLAELLNAAVVDERNRMNMPSRHPLNHSQRGAAMIRQADVILALEPMDLFGTLNNVDDLIGRPSQPKTRAGVKVIVLGTTDTNIKANTAEYERYQSADLGITGDAETSLPWLIQAVEKEMTPARKAMADARGQKLKEAGGKFILAAHEEAAMAWDASPVSTARLSAELWNHLKSEDWTMASEVNFLSNWPYRLWSMEKHYNSMGGSVGGGVGYNAPAALGAALANKGTGRVTVSLNGDGDLMMSPGVLWTAAHHQIPILYIVHNNRAWHQEYMHVQRMAQRNERGIERAHIGTTMDNPNIDFATLAKSMGVYSQGPISNPADVGAAIQRAIAVVKKGEPALIDVVSQPR